MRNIPRFAAATILALAVVGAVSVACSKAQSPPTDTTRKPVLVELFTSEGCSSCPPADQLLQRLVAQQPVAGAQIIAIEEHVDYWNHDGWIDPFSSAEWTERQLVYTPQTNDNGPYTPEMIVDGMAQFVGSDQSKALASIQTAAAQLKTDVSISAEGAEQKNSREFAITVGKLPAAASGDGAEVWLAVTEDGLHSSVSRGENAGRALNHVATLRSMHKIGSADANAATDSFTGHTRVKIDSHWNAANVHVIAFVQEKKSHTVLGAASAKIAG